VPLSCAAFTVLVTYIVIDVAQVSDVTPSRVTARRNRKKFRIRGGRFRRAGSVGRGYRRAKGTRANQSLRTTLRPMTKSRMAMATTLTASQ